MFLRGMRPLNEQEPQNARLWCGSRYAAILMAHDATALAAASGHAAPSFSHIAEQ